MSLKHDCPPPAKFGSAEPLWKTATVNFLKATKDVVAALKEFGSGASSSSLKPESDANDRSAELSEESYVSIWEQVVEGFSGALLAETCVFSSYVFLSPLSILTSSTCAAEASLTRPSRTCTPRRTSILLFSVRSSPSSPNFLFTNALPPSLTRA
jgi:hypothetical protein